MTTDVPASRRSAAFREICATHGLAVTHQRSAIFQALQELDGHPSPERVFEHVRQTIPEISQATVFKTLHTFVDHDLVKEVSPLRGSMRMEVRSEPHHHLVCRSCQTIVDLEEDQLERIVLPGAVPSGFRAEQLRVEIIGICANCAAKPLSAESKL